PPGTGHRLGKLQQAVTNAVVGHAIHIAQQVIETIQLTTEGNKRQAVLTDATKGHRTSTAYLTPPITTYSVATHVGVRRHVRLIKLDRSRLGAPKHVLLLIH